MENSEADPDQLENLFRMDHLATRMRRNGENLLVLAGEEPGRRWTEPVPLVDILRAASSEVEHYERIEISGIPETDIHGQVVNDLVHLLAELLENAASFSSPQTKVRVTATRLPDGRMMIEIHDKGIGLTAEDFADINHKLANPPTVDASISQRMGLFVVGRLADRHNIRVQLRPSGEQAGTTSLVMLPDAITHGGGGEESPEEEFSVSRIVPEQPRVQPAAPPPVDSSPSAAELGFDDSRYGTSEDLSSLGPVGRSRMREERRAAVEAQQPGAAPQLPARESGQQPYGPGGQPYEQPYGLNGQDHLQQPYGQTQQPQDPYGQQGRPYGGQPAQAPYGQPADGTDGQQPYGPGGQPYGTGAAPYEQPALSPSEQPYTQPSEQPALGPASPQQGVYEGQYAAQQPEAESAPGTPDGAQDRVGFDRPGPLPSSYRSTTDAGLPRREPGRPQQEETQTAQHQARPDGPGTSPELAAQPSSQGETGTHRRSSNDERWDRAGQLRDPQAGGVTSSGLPRRVPRANLVEGAAEESPQAGPSVSRAPEDVRGRLSNLHRGVRRGRTAGDANQNDRQGFGPGSTYDQER
jgi:hypothetical protein